MFWRWLVVAAVGLVILLLLFAHAAGVEGWTVGSGVGALLVAGVASVFRRRRAQPAPAPVVETSRATEVATVAPAVAEAQLEERRIEEHRATEQKRPLEDRAQAIIDRNRRRRP